MIPIILSELISHPEPPAGEAPFDVEIGAADLAGAAFHAVFEGNDQFVVFPFVCFGGAEYGAPFALAFGAYLGILLHQVTLLIGLGTDGI